LTTSLWRLLFPDLYTEIEKLKRRVNDLSTDVQALDAALDTLGTDVGELRQAVVNLINSLPPEVEGSNAAGNTAHYLTHRRKNKAYSDRRLMCVLLLDAYFYPLFLCQILEVRCEDSFLVDRWRKGFLLWEENADHIHLDELGRK
jgi:outer membrane murein-binding lipoprotein Lpp